MLHDQTRDSQIALDWPQTVSKQVHQGTDIIEEAHKSGGRTVLEVIIVCISSMLSLKQKLLHGSSGKAEVYHHKKVRAVDLLVMELVEERQVHKTKTPETLRPELVFLHCTLFLHSKFCRP